MSIVNGEMQQELICDNCGDNCGTGTWQQLQEQMKRDGWLIEKVDGAWKTYCPMCRNNF